MSSPSTPGTALPVPAPENAAGVPTATRTAAATRRARQPLFVQSRRAMGPGQALGFGRLSGRGAVPGDGPLLSFLPGQREGPWCDRGSDHDPGDGLAVAQELVQEVLEIG